MHSKDNSGFQLGDGYDEFPQYRNLAPRSREIISTWAFLCHINEARLSITTKGESIKREIVQALNRNSELAGKIKAWKTTHVIPENATPKIPEDGRRNRIIRKELLWQGITPSFYHQELTELENTTAAIDVAECAAKTKLLALNGILFRLPSLTETDGIFDWFDGEQSSEKISLAESILCNISTNSIFNTPPPKIKTKLDIIEHFDGALNTWKSRQDFVKKVKRHWSQKKYKENNNGKKQKNFLLSEVTIKRLEKIAKMHDISQTQALEILILMESKEKKYIKKRMNTVTITDDEPPV